MLYQGGVESLKGYNSSKGSDALPEPRNKACGSLLRGKILRAAMLHPKISYKQSSTAKEFSPRERTTLRKKPV
jgi:hypothetical protein